jgi:hypothetical protein
MKYIQNLKKHLVNIPGWRTGRRIVVFESDDWGSIRMPDKKTYEKSIRKGLPVKRHPYCTYDTLANAEDLHALYDVLRSVKDKNGNHPVITANTVVANPDFEKIKASQFEEYHFEPFTKTLTRYYPNSNVFDLWKQGIKENLFYPQFHGREHVNVYHWLLGLKSNQNLQKAFDLGYWGLPKKAYSESVDINNLQATYDAKDKSELELHKKSLQEGLNLFEKLFGYPSRSFIPNNFIFDKKELAAVLKENGVLVLQGMKYHKDPCYNNDRHPMARRYPGLKNGFTELLRNCLFEPTQEKSKTDVVGKCLHGISTAFCWKKPVIITVHRLNLTGAIEEKNREENLFLFKELLDEILMKWPDVEFMNSVDLSSLMSQKSVKNEH